MVQLMPNSCATILVLIYCSAHSFRITNDPLAGSNHKDFTTESGKPSRPHGFCVYHMLGWNMLKHVETIWFLSLAFCKPKVHLEKTTNNKSQTTGWQSRIWSYFQVLDVPGHTKMPRKLGCHRLSRQASASFPVLPDHGLEMPQSAL